ncbi:MAG: tripartite tricarboxylate transporter permease [Bilophila wadsworthia]
MLDMILAGLSEALQLANLLFVLLGVIAGMIAGAIPGVNGPMAIALCIPLSIICPQWRPSASSSDSTRAHSSAAPFPACC